MNKLPMKTDGYLSRADEVIKSYNDFPTLGRAASYLTERMCSLAQSLKVQALVTGTSLALIGGAYFIPTAVVTVPTTAVAAYVASDPFVSALVGSAGTLSAISSEKALETACQNYNDEAFSYMLKDGVMQSEEALQNHLADIAVRKEVYGIAASRACQAGDLANARNYAMKDLLWNERNMWNNFQNLAASDIFNSEELMSIFTERYNKFSSEGNTRLVSIYARLIDGLRFDI